jgi:hypothetical protein
MSSGAESFNVRQPLMEDHMSDQNSNQNPETEAPETCALDHAPITVQRFGRGYRCSAVVGGNLLSLYFPSCTLTAAFTAFEQFIAAEVR